MIYFSAKENNYIYVQRCQNNGQNNNQLQITFVLFLLFSHQPTYDNPKDSFGDWNQLNQQIQTMQNVSCTKHNLNHLSFDFVQKSFREKVSSPPLNFIYTGLMKASY